MRKAIVNAVGWRRLRAVWCDHAISRVCWCAWIVGYITGESSEEILVLGGVVKSILVYVLGNAQGHGVRLCLRYSICVINLPFELYL